MRLTLRCVRSSYRRRKGIFVNSALSRDEQVRTFGFGVRFLSTVGQSGVGLQLASRRGII